MEPEDRADPPLRPPHAVVALLLCADVLVVTGGALAAFLFEQRGHGSFTSYGAAWSWALRTVAGLPPGEVAPATCGARLAERVLAIVGAGAHAALVSFLAAVIGRRASTGRG